jgi:hypothetical protein
MYLGDYDTGKTVRFKFTTRDAGIPYSLSGGVVYVYKDASTTKSSSGVALTADFDSRTGLNHVAIDMTADSSFYAAGSDFTAVLCSGTVNGYSVAGEVLRDFSIQNRSPLRPATAGRTFEVSSAGYGSTDMKALNSSTSAASNQRRAAEALYAGTVTATSTSGNIIDSGLTGVSGVAWVNRTLIFSSGTLIGQAKTITDFNSNVPSLIAPYFSAAPASGDPYGIF